MISVVEKQIRVVICDTMTAQEAPILVSDVKTQHQTCGAGLYYLAIIPENATVPEPRVREAMTEGLRVIQSLCEYTGFVFCGTGLKASVKRTAFNTILLAILKGRWHVGSSIDELVKKAGEDLKCVTHLRRAGALAAQKGYRV